jgi:hypothetical protein
MQELSLTQNWIYPKNQIIRLVGRSALSRRLLEQTSIHWTVEPVPGRYTKKECETALMGWLYVKSLTLGRMWVHVTNDENFHVVLYDNGRPQTYQPLPFILFHPEELAHA